MNAKMCIFPEGTGGLSSPEHPNRLAGLPSRVSNGYHRYVKLSTRLLVMSRLGLREAMPQLACAYSWRSA